MEKRRKGKGTARGGRTTSVLIVSDDFGMCDAVNRGTVEAMIRGVVRASNFLVPCPWFEGAYRLAKQHGLPVGIHLNITCEWLNCRWRSLTCAPTITDPEGYFYAQFSRFSESADMDDVYREYRAQVDLLRNRNWDITHIDSHMLGPSQTGRLARNEAKFIEVVKRIAYEEQLPYLYELDGHRLRYFDSAFVLSGRSFDEFAVYIQSLKGGRHLVISHCAHPTEELAHLTGEDASDYPWTVEYRRSDSEILTSPQTMSLLNDCGVVLITARDIEY